ncbi:hypothetical protein PHMEG_0009677 [Phytophthora megakarya]|uniref:Uncharacterized protein n=1 Tax=Phytophthora megakarya TaxID=4795 RepID=A0A225WI24_9STRA|nr:hypothetical protein PHMEG_0009677 [Phytophthora megakarya]
MRRAPCGLDTPAETIGQEEAAVKVFKDFLVSTALSNDDLDKMHTSISQVASLSMQTFYSLLTAFSIDLQTKKSEKARAADGFLAKSTALGYFSQIVNLLRERYSASLSDSKRISKISDKMTSAIDERNLRAYVQTNDAPGCTLNNLSIDTYFARKHQLILSASGELFLHISRVKTSVVHGGSIYKSAEYWQQCMLHISTRGAWLLESLTKAFAYIGTTSREDQSGAKVLTGYPAPDIHHVYGSSDPRSNVATDVVNASFAALIMHLKQTLDAQLSGAAAGGDSVLASTLENMFAPLPTINDRIARVEDIVGASAGLTTGHAEPLSAVQVAQASLVSSSTVVAPAAGSTLAGCFLNWYMHRIWETVSGKKEQNKRADAKAAVNITKELYRTPCEIPPQPDRSDKAAHATWKHELWTLAFATDNITNERLNA